MTLNTRFYRLTALHRRIDEALARENRRRGADPFRLLRLKVARLAVKKRLTSLTRGPTLAF